MNGKIVVAEAIADAALDTLRESYDVESLAGASNADLVDALGDAIALIVRSGTQVDKELIAAGPMLRVIGRAGVGLDNIDVEAATAGGITVVNAPDASTISVAEHTMSLLLAQARRIPEADASLRAGRWDRKELQGVELYGKTLGLIGLGRIGAQVAKRAKAFGMRVLAFDPLINAERAAEADVELVAFDDLLAEADFLSIHAPRTPETELLIDGEAFERMKPTARIVNAARGGIVDEEALARAVGDGIIAGAAVDVFAVEPASASPLFEDRRIVVTPHLGASTAEAQLRAGTSTVEAVIAALQAAGS